jgi:hypothetical protein
VELELCGRSGTGKPQGQHDSCQQRELFHSSPSRWK